MTLGRVALRLGYFCLAVLIAGCGTDRLGISDKDATYALIMSVQSRNDEVAEKLVRIVLQDEIQRGYRYTYDARMNASDAIRGFQMKSVARLLRAVALIEPAGEEPQRSLDAIAVNNALFDLTSLRDRDAAALNVRAMANPLSAWTALLDLQTLEYWEVTPKVQTLLANATPRPEEMSMVVAALEYLSKSPQADSTACDAVKHLTCTYAVRCRDYSIALRNLEERFGCERSKQGAPAH